MAPPLLYGTLRVPFSDFHVVLFYRTMDLLEIMNRDEEPLGLPELNREVSVSDWLNNDV